MIITVVALLIIASVPLTGGRLSRMSGLAFRSVWLVAASLAVQIAITVVFVHADPTLLAVIHVGSYLLAAAFLWRNRAVPGLLCIGGGGMLNFAAISANAGLMPASARALEIAGLADDGGFSNSTAVDGARLQLLGDIFAIPAGMPFANVFSIGDLVLLVGVAILVHRVSRGHGVTVGATAPTSPGGGQPAPGGSAPADHAAAVPVTKHVPHVPYEPYRPLPDPSVRQSRARTARLLAGEEGRDGASCCGATRPHRCCSGADRGVRRAPASAADGTARVGSTAGRDGLRDRVEVGVG